MIPFLTYPLALIALATLPALAAIYILRNRFRRRPVSSLILWNFHVQSKQGGAKVHRLQLPLLFFLELLILLLLVTAATGPHWKLPQSTRPLIVVLDDSFSMRALHDGTSTQARAKDFLAGLYRHQAPPVTRLILAGTESRSLGGSVHTWSEINNLLPQWQCWSPAATLDSAITLASELGKNEANILILTDHQPADTKISNPRLQWRSFGFAADNVAIVNASRTAFGEQDRCLLEIVNFSPKAGASQLLIQAGTNTLQNSPLLLGAHESQRIVFNVPKTAPALHISLPDDALLGDNDALLLPPVRKQVRVRVAVTNESLTALLDRALAATGLRAALSVDPELVIHDTDTITGSNAWSLRWNVASATNAFTGPFIIDSSHPLAEDISLAGVIWAGANLTNAPGEIPVILAGNTPLLSTREDAVGRRLNLNFNPELSTLQNTPDWPILFWNILSWRAAESPGLREHNARLGTEVTLKTDGGPVKIIQPGGIEHSFSKTGGDLAIETPVPGIYSVIQNGITNNLAVNVLSAEKSDLSACITGSWGVWNESVEHRMEEASVAWLFGLLATGLLATHLYLVFAAKGGR